MGSGLLVKVIIILVSAIILLVCVVLLCCTFIFKISSFDFLRPKKKIVPKLRREQSKIFDPSLDSISITELASGTDHFHGSRVIGDGGFGLVYLATLSGGRNVAVKRLSAEGIQGKREFEAEIETLGKIQHKNLVKLRAYCKSGEDRVLVYEYIKNGSLDSWLHEREGGPNVLDWKIRLKIAEGSAQGLAFLHHDCDPHIIHRDIKSSNILLTEEFEARIADFGLARNMSPLASHVSTEAAGTLGYMAPEYAGSLTATLQADVYSFGILMLELATRRRPATFIKESNMRTLAKWARQLAEEARHTELLDSVLKDVPMNEAAEYFSIACKCTALKPVDRPTMQEVAKFLSLIGSQHVCTVFD